MQIRLDWMALRKSGKEQAWRETGLTILWVCYGSRIKDWMDSNAL